MKRDARIGLAIILVLGLFTTFMVARSLNQRTEDAEHAENRDAKPPTASVLAEPDGWTPDTLKPTESVRDPLWQTQQQELDRYLDSRIPVPNDARTTHVPATFPDERDPPVPTSSENTFAPRPLPYEALPSLEPQSAPTAPSAEQAYTIQAGDNPWKISAKLFGDGKYAMKIMAANPGVDPAKLKVGQQIKIPSLASVPSVAQPVRSTLVILPSAAEMVVAEAVPLSKLHTVQNGETLSAIAHKYYGSAGPKSLKRLTDANPGLDAKRLKIGASLKVPPAL